MFLSRDLKRGNEAFVCYILLPSSFLCLFLGYYSEEKGEEKNVDSFTFLIFHGELVLLLLLLLLLGSAFFLAKQSHIGNGEVTLPIFLVTIPYLAPYHNAGTGGGKLPQQFPWTRNSLRSSHRHWWSFRDAPASSS